MNISILGLPHELLVSLLLHAFVEVHEIRRGFDLVLLGTETLAHYPRVIRICYICIIG